MLSTSYLSDCPDEVVRIYSRLESEVLQLIAKRLAKKGYYGKDVSQWQMDILRECGLLRSDVEKLIAKYDKEAQREILRLFDEAMKKSSENDFQRMGESQKQHIDTLSDRLKEPGRVNKDYADMVKKFANDYTFNNIRRLTATIADTSQRMFIEQANNAYMQVASGAVSYDEAIKNACHNLAKEGVYTVDYSQSGKVIRRTIESSVRANVITGINQSASEQTLKNCETLENDLVETSAHLGARNKDGKHVWSNHEAWQGRVFHLGGGRNYTDGNGETKFAPSFKDACGLGFADGICGVNCRHSYYPYFEGTKQTFSQPEEETLEVDGEKITRYEAEQKQRYLERGVRYWKRQADVLQAAGQDDTQARMKIREWQQKAKAWSDKAGVARDYAREAIGTKSGRAVYGKGKYKNDMLAEEGDASDTKIVLPENFGKIQNFKNQSKEEKFNSVCDWAVRKGVEQNGEQVVLLDANNNPIAFQKIKGNKGELSDRLERILDNSPEKSITLIHNHNNNASFSYEDFLTTNHKPAIKEIYAGTPNGTRYKFSIPKGLHVVDEEFEKIYNDARDLIKSRYGLDKMSKEEIKKNWAFLSNEINSIVARKLQWKYKKESK